MEPTASSGPTRGHLVHLSDQWTARGRLHLHRERRFLRHSQRPDCGTLGAQLFSYQREYRAGVHEAARGRQALGTCGRLGLAGSLLRARDRAGWDHAGASRRGGFGLKKKGELFKSAELLFLLKPHKVSDFPFVRAREMCG